MKQIKLILFSFLPLLLASCEKGIEPSSSITNDNLILANTSEFKEANSMLALGEKKLLVIPIVFKDEREFTSAQLENINRAFFEDGLSGKGNYYYSLTEYYQKSSLGKLSFSGEVTDVLHVNYTVKEASDSNYLPGVPALQFMEDTSYNDEFFQKYDLNEDGFIDSSVFVYSTPKSERTGSFWAWVNTFSTESNLTRPTFSRHMWVGIDFFEDDAYEIDTHTIIHESGHLLGLRDYYPSDNYNLALGGHSMMDYNISDQDPYSKMLLDWCDPIYYDFDGYDSVTVNLKPFEDTNDFILIKNEWNHSVMDEYLLLEYYTPTGVNELDSKTKYSNRPLGFTESGIKLYHVDSRIAKCYYDEEAYAVKFQEYVNEIPSSAPDGEYYLIGASNNTSDSRTDASRQGRFKQIALIENKEYNTLQMGQSADNDSLFQAGDSFDSSSSVFINNNKWNDGNEMNISFTVNSMDSSQANITITYGGN